MMEIHIHISGVEMGPFSEKQVRQYLEEGVLAHSDLARYEGMEEWETVEAVLARLVPVPTTTVEPGALPEPEPGAVPPPEPTPPFTPPEETLETIQPEFYEPATDSAPAFTKPKIKRKPNAQGGKIILQQLLPLTTTAPVETSVPDAEAAAASPKLSVVAAKSQKAARVKAFVPPNRVLLKAVAEKKVPPAPEEPAVDPIPATPEMPAVDPVMTAPDAVAPPAPAEVMTEPAEVPAEPIASVPTPQPPSPPGRRSGASTLPTARINWRRISTLPACVAGTALVVLMIGTFLYIDSLPWRMLSRNHQTKLENIPPSPANHVDAPAPEINPAAAADYDNRGLLKAQKGDLDGAILDYNQALDLDPTLAVAYSNRGDAKYAGGNPDGAIADYTQAVTLDPKLALAYCHRGSVRQAKGDADGATLDYDQALALDPKIATAYYNRGLLKEQKGDLDGAIADSTQAIDLDPKDAQAYCNRGLARLGRDDLDEAMSDLKTFCQLAPKDPDADDARLYIWLISKEENPGAKADEELAASLQTDWNSTPEGLESRIAGFVLGHVKEDDLIAAAASPDPGQEPGRICKARYFIGMKRLLAGDKANAADQFRQCLATGARDHCEYIFARAELRALGQSQP